MIRTDNLISTYAQDSAAEKVKTILSGINLEISEGEFVAVLGHNGSGKSTLAKHFNAIMLPVGGKVYVDEMDTTDETLAMQIRQRAGMVFQNPDNQMVATIVEDDVAFAPENLGVPREEIRRRVDNALCAVGMYEFRDKAPHLLSGGQKQRVAIAGVIAMEPKYIILDEPTAMLDPTGRKEVLDTIIRLNREKGITVVLITHYMDEAVQADRVVVIDDGKIVIDDKPTEVFVQVERLKEIGLDVPQATELMYCLIKQGLPVSQAVLNADTCVEEIIKLAKENGVI